MQRDNRLTALLESDVWPAILVGLFVVVSYGAGGLIVGGWDVTDFIRHLSSETVGWLVWLIVFTIAMFAVPIITLRRYEVRGPLVVLGGVLLVWIGIGVGNDLLGPNTFFGLGLYAFGLAPVYLIAYLIVGIIEYQFLK